VRRHIRSITAVVGGLALAATAVGVAGTASAGPCAKPWRIGLEGPITGSQSSVGMGMLDGAILAAENLNAHRGLLGRPVQIVPIDDQANPTVGVAAVKAALKAGLDGVVGPYNSGVGAQVLPLYAKARIVPIRLTTAASTEGYGVTLQPMEDQIAPVAVTALTTWQKATSVAVIYDSTSPYTVGVAAQVQSSLAAQGVTVTSMTPITEGQSDYTSVVTQALSGHPSALYAAVYYPEGGLIAKEVLASGTSSTCLADYASASTGYVTAAGLAAAQNCPVLGVPAPSDFAGSAPLVARFQARFHTAPGLWSPYSYDSVNLLAQAATRAHTLEQVPLAKALYGTTGFTGWTGTASILRPSGNRSPAPVTVDVPDAAGDLHIDAAWAAAVGATP
jgi:branched-chain amino acid transport system substrate-binding protein